jgi:transposase-like protein
MKEADILAPHFQDENAARVFLEAKRWPDGVVCPHCGVIGEAYRLHPTTKGKKTAVRKGVWKCGGCREQFTVTVGTVMEDSHIPLNKWLLAFHLLCASKKGMSAHQLHRMLGVTYKSAWFMTHRIRHAMTQEPLSSKLDGVVEIDEAYIGGRRRAKNNHGGGLREGETEKTIGNRTWRMKPGKPGGPKGVHPYADKETVLSLVQRGGKVRSLHMGRVTQDNLRPVLDQYLAEGVHVMTDCGTSVKLDDPTHKHDKVNHTVKEYVRYENGVCITTNTVEGYFATLKRGIDGVYHHVGKQHLNRYLTEFDFRYNSRDVSDSERAELAVKGADGKRLMYRDSFKRV